MSRLFFGSLVKTKGTSKDKTENEVGEDKIKDQGFELDKLSILCKNPHWEYLLEENKGGVLMVDKVFKAEVSRIDNENSKKEDKMLIPLSLARRFLLNMDGERTTPGYNPNSEAEQKNRILEVLENFCQTVKDKKKKKYSVSLKLCMKLQIKPQSTYITKVKKKLCIFVTNIKKRNTKLRC